MKISLTEVYGFRAALRGMRNPMNSWDKSDTKFGMIPHEHRTPFCVGRAEKPNIGPDDLKLACKLIKGGSEHRKFLRQIVVWADMTLPRYVWTEMDTYKVATVRNSCSTMHKLGHRELDFEDFEGGVVLPAVLSELNGLGHAFRDKRGYTPAGESPRDDRFPLRGYDLVRWMKAILPESFLQKATMTFTYETLLNMFFQREHHRLPQWRFSLESGDLDSGPSSICNWIYCLPYMEQFIAAARK